MIYGRGTVWVICSEKYDPKFYSWTGTDVDWVSDIRRSKFFIDKNDAQVYLEDIIYDPKDSNIKKSELKYISIIELELVQHWPNRHTE